MLASRLSIIRPPGLETAGVHPMACSGIECVRYAARALLRIARRRWLYRKTRASFERSARTGSHVFSTRSFGGKVSRRRRRPCKLK